MSMKKRLAFGILAFLILSSVQGQTPLLDFTEKAQAFLRHYVAGGKVDYAGVKAKWGEIESLHTQIGKMNLTQASDNSRKAFYINA